jgi:hypothetical protein
MIKHGNMGGIRFSDEHLNDHVSCLESGLSMPPFGIFSQSCSGERGWMRTLCLTLLAFATLDGRAKAGQASVPDSWMVAGGQGQEQPSKIAVENCSSFWNLWNATDLIGYKTWKRKVSNSLESDLLFVKPQNRHLNLPPIWDARCLSEASLIVMGAFVHGQTHEPRCLTHVHIFFRAA